MTFERITATRKWIGRAAALFCALFALAALDGLVSHFRQPLDVLHMLPGDADQVNGSLTENVKGIDELAWSAESPGLRFEFEAVHSGFWMGGLMWRGHLALDPGLAPGKYTLEVTLKAKPAAKPQTRFTVIVFGNEREMNRTSGSFLQSRLDLSPWHVAVFFLGMIALTIGCVYLCSRAREKILSERGIAEIYLIMESPAGTEIYFGMGSGRGTEPGVRIEIMNEEIVPVGRAIVSKVTEKDAMAIVGEGARPRPGFLVRRMP